MPNLAKQTKAKVKTGVKASPRQSMLFEFHKFKNTHLIPLSLSSPKHIMDSFAWASVSQAAGLAGGSAVSDGRGGGGLLPPMAGFHLPPPAGLEHFSMDSSLVERAVRSSCFGAGTETASASNGIHDEATTGDCSSGGPAPDSENMKRSTEVGAHCSPPFTLLCTCLRRFQSLLPKFVAAGS